MGEYLQIVQIIYIYIYIYIVYNIIYIYLYIHYIQVFYTYIHIQYICIKIDPVDPAVSSQTVLGSTGSAYIKYNYII